MPSEPVAVLDAESGPALELEWEMGVFKAFRALVRRLSPGKRPAYDEGRAALLSPRAEVLSVFAQLIAGGPLRVRPAQGAGGVIGRTLYLPPHLDALGSPEENEQLYLLRAAVSAAMALLSPKVPEGRLARVEAEARAAVEASRRLAAELPAFGPAYARVSAALLALRPEVSGAGDEQRCEQSRREALLSGISLDPSLSPPSVRSSARAKVSPPVPLWGELLAPGDEPGAGAGDAEHGRPRGVTTEIAAPPVDEIKLVTLDQKELEDAVLQHTFEKVDTADSYQGGARDLDGADQLDEHLEALEEVPLGQVIRTDERTSSVLRADVSIGAGIPDVATVEPGEQGVAYDEWDASKRAYRKGWCTVYPSALRGVDEAWGRAAADRQRGLIADLKKKLGLALERRRRATRRRDGPQVDIDALVGHLASIKAGSSGSDRLYVRREKALPEVATTVLLDLSLSADAWVDDRRVLDVSREAVVVLGEVLSSLGEKLELLGFASQTRNRCRVFEIASRDEPWALARARLGALVPQGYTRIGAALRHATRSVEEAGTRKRLVLLISDGKPNDYDRYEGKHGIDDVRQAVREANQRGTIIHGLTVDPSSREAFPAMMGQGAWHVLRQPSELPRALTEVYARVMLGG